MKIIKFLPFILILLYHGAIKDSGSLTEDAKLIVLISFVVISVITLIYVIKNKPKEDQNKTSLVLLSLGILATIFLYFYSLKP